jgi:hypothetical protein
MMQTSTSLNLARLTPLVALLHHMSTQAAVAKTIIANKLSPGICIIAFKLATYQNSMSFGIAKSVCRLPTYYPLLHHQLWFLPFQLV